ncbi:SF16 protein [Artemisia annua]|uniref:SF16 protein n=1 Tax=Artemisia annua TaxID=35608 RepID=A0A2U1NX77_ARTAN|nr:SF16 protein [Artemisia annua]
MGKKSWFSAVKKLAVNPSFSKVKKDKRSHKSKSNPKKTLDENEMSLDIFSSQTEATLANPPSYYPSKEDIELEQPQSEQIKYVDTIFYATPMVVDVEETVSHAKVSCVTSSPHFLGKSKEEIGAIRIQMAYRGYLARKDYRPLRARKRLTLLIRGHAAKRQTASALIRMQTMARVQSQVRSRGIRMAEVNEALQKQLRQRREEDVVKRSGFDLTPKSKEQVEARLRNKKEAAERREMALAYAYSRQQTWRNSLLSPNPTVTDSNYPEWGWNWSEQWNAIRPWDTTTISSKPVSSLSKPFSSLSPAKSSIKLVSSPVTHSHKGSTPSLNVGSRISKPGTRLLGSGKKGAANAVSVAGLANKLSYSPSSGIKRTLGAPRKSSNPRWNL